MKRRLYGLLFPSPMLKRYLPFISLLACLLLAYAVYSPGLTGYYLFDDTINIVENQHLRIQSLDWNSLVKAALSGDAGRLGRPISVLSFALEHYANGLAPYNLKLTNVAIHLLNGICVFFLSNLLLQAHHTNCGLVISHWETRWICLAVAAAWLLHPLNLSGVLYIVQRMTSLATLFTLLGLISYIHGRHASRNSTSGWYWVCASFFLFLPMAAFSKENGALLPVFLLLAELVFFRFQTRSPITKRLLLSLFGITTLLPFILVLGYTAYKPEWITAIYSIRDFTLAERLMTEARVLWLYIRLAIAPDITALGMYHDDLVISKGLFEPASTFFAIVGVTVLGIAGAMSIKRHPIAAFGILLFLAGHSMESSVFALELVHEHRNYLPLFGVLLPLFYYLMHPIAHRESLVSRRFAGIIFIGLLGAVTFLRATHWGNAVTMKEKEVEHHPESVRANISMASFFAAMPPTTQAEAEQFYFQAYTYYAKASSLSESDTLGLFGLIALNNKYSRPIEETWENALAYRLEHKPFAPSTGNSLVNLQQCVLNGNCASARSALERFLQAALRNPTLRGRAKSQVLFAWSDYLFSIKHQTNAAVEAAYNAADVTPSNVDTQLTLITFLVNMGRYAEASERIAQVRRLDKLKLYTSELDKIEHVLTQNTSR